MARIGYKGKLTFRKDTIEEIFRLLEEGLTEERIAKYFCVGVPIIKRTILENKEKFKHVKNSI